MPIFLFLIGLAFVCAAILVQMLPASLRALLPASSEEVTLPKQYLWSVLLAILAYNVFTYDNGTLALGMGGFGALVVVALVSALPRAKQTFFAWSMTVVGVLASLAFAWRANEFIQVVNMATVLTSIASLLFVHAVDHIEWSVMWMLRTVFLYPAMAFQRLPGTFRLLKPGKFSGVSMVVRVAAITIVLVLFFAAILSSADPIFAEKIRVLREEIVPRTILSIILAAVFVLAFASRFGKAYTYETLHVRFLSWLETAVPVASVCVLFGVFLWVQATYLFVDHTSFKALDLTYAEYVRKGMIEVLVATACAGVLSYVVSLKERELKQANERGVLYAVNAVLLVELVLMLASAWKRDVMYMEVYGLTRVRVIGEIFLAWLAVIVLLLAVFALWKRLREKAVFAGVITACIAVVAFLNVSNMDARIVSAAPPDGRQHDAYYMSLLSVDAVDEWEAVIRSMAETYESLRTDPAWNEDERNRLANIVRASEELLHERNFIMLPNDTPTWRTWRWSDQHARAAMSASIAFRETLPCLATELTDLRSVRTMPLHEEIGLLEYGYNRPFVSAAGSYDWYENRSGVTADSCL